MKAQKTLRPRRRTDDLISETVGNEVLLYKLDEHKALRINAIAGEVWRRCDGKRSIRDIAREISAETGESVQEDLVEYTVGRLAKAGLLDARDSEVISRVSRRHLLGRLGIAAGALPVIIALTAPRAFAQTSDGCAGTVTNKCGTGKFGCGSPCDLTVVTMGAMDAMDIITTFPCKGFCDRVGSMPSMYVYTCVTAPVGMSSCPP